MATLKKTQQPVDLSPYMPLAGGTFTGPIAGTSATFSGDVTANTHSVAGTSIVLYQSGLILDAQPIRWRRSAFGSIDAGIDSPTAGNVRVHDGSGGAANLAVTGTGTFGAAGTLPVALINGGTSTPGPMQVEFGYGGSRQYKHWISTKHNAGSAGGNGILFYTSDGTASGAFPTNAVLGLIIENGTVAVPGALSAASLTTTGSLSVLGFSTDVGGNSTFTGRISAANFVVFETTGNVVTNGTLTAASLNLGGATLLDVLSATAALDFPAVSIDSYQDLTITVTGAVVGDGVILGMPSAPDPDLSYEAFVSTADTVTVRAHNHSPFSAADPASGTFRATVLRI